MTTPDEPKVTGEPSRGDGVETAPVTESSIDLGPTRQAPAPAPTGPAPSGVTEPPVGWWTAARNWWDRQPWYSKWLGRLIALGIAVLLPYMGSVPGIGPQVITTGTDWYTALFHMSYYVLLALGLNVVVGYAGLLDLGYAGFFAVGTYVVALLCSPDSVFGTQWGWLAAVPVSVAIAMFSGLILGWPTLRLRGDYLAIVTLGFAEIIRIFADSLPLLRGDRGFSFIPHPPGKYSDGKPIFGDIDARPYYYLGLGIVVLVILGVSMLDRSRVGRSWLAIREDEEAAEIMGVRTVRYKLWAFTIGAFIAGLAGALFAGANGFINSSTFVLQLSILVLSGVVMGGAGNIPGAILGGILISYIPDRLTGISVGGTDLAQYKFMFFGLAIILIMIFRPQGLIPSRRRAMELKDREREAAPQ
jgi:branched-chain amino acid transport system permease protein